MTGNTERHEQARQYFIACEQGLKAATQKIQSSKNIDKLFSAIENMNTMFNFINDKLFKLEEQTQSQQQIETTYKKPYKGC